MNKLHLDTCEFNLILYFSMLIPTNVFKNIKVIIIVLALGFLELSSIPEPPKKPLFDDGILWADSLMETMSLDQKIGQLFMVAAMEEIPMKLIT